MRKPRDIDAELRALQNKAKALKARRVVQLGELVTLTGADALDLETLAGALLAAVDGSKQSVTKEAWRSEGVQFFLSRRRKTKVGGVVAFDGACVRFKADASGGPAG
jgi:hypothetical protein